jgi:hypothetical protein
MCYFLENFNAAGTNILYNKTWGRRFTAIQNSDLEGCKIDGNEK